MMNEFLTEDTQAIILLCGVFGTERSQKPLSLAEYLLLVRWLIAMKMRPGDLLQSDTIQAASMSSGIDRQRLQALLGRGVQLGFAVEEWQRNGIWIISRSDADYPVRYKKHLQDKAPPLLFGAGNRALLKGGGLGVVGSRNVDQAGASFARQAAELCAINRMPVVSGGARGVDQLAMNAALEAGGVSIGILAENLLQKSVERNARQAIAAGRLLLLSPYHPNARFTVGAAMGRNKLIYAMSDYGLVVSAEHKKGGTWAGAEEELKRKNALPVFVRTGIDTPQGNSELLNLGAIAWPDSIDSNNFSKQLYDLGVSANDKPHNNNSKISDFQADQEAVAVATEIVGKQAPIAAPEPIVAAAAQIPTCPTSIYQAVLPVILHKLDNPATAEELAKTLDVNKTQLNAWLKKAVDENQLIKLSKPVRYQKQKSGVQAQLW